jgi:hypothetical protein
MKACRAAGLAWLVGLGLAGFGAPRGAHAQAAVAFQPVISTFPDGVMLSATPVVTADRRYVRFTNLQPQFTALQEFNVFVIPAAVSGGGIGGIGGGLGGIGIGGAGGGGGFGSVPVMTPGDPLALATVAAPGDAPAATAREERRPAGAKRAEPARPRRGGRRAPQP